MGYKADSQIEGKQKKNQNNFSMNNIWDLVSKYSIYIVLLVIVFYLSLASPNFLSVRNLSNVLLQSSVIGTASIGMTFILLVRGIDVSVGSMMVLGSAVSVMLMLNDGLNPLLGIVVMILVPTLIGVFNGFSTAYLGVPAFIATLASLQIARGLALSISGGRSWYNLPEIFSQISRMTFGPIHIAIVVFLLCALFAHILLSKTTYGKHIYAVGSNPEAARVSGINVKKTILSAFVLGGFFTGIGTVLITARMNSFFPTMGQGYEFDAIASVVIGGTSLFGGVGWIGGTIFGVIFMGIINNGLNLLNVSAFYQMVAKGSVIFIAVLFDTLKVRYERKVR